MSAARPSAGALIAYGLIAIGLAEGLATVAASRDRIDASTWAAVDAQLAAATDAGASEPSGAAGLATVDPPVVLAQEWLAPPARMHSSTLADRRWLGLPDLFGVPEFFVVGHGRAWGPGVEQLIDDGDARPQWHDARSAGALGIHRYARATRWQALDDMRAHVGATGPKPLRVEHGGRKCRRARGTSEYRCDRTTVSAGLVEVNYTTRRCVVLRAEDDAPIVLHAPAFRLGDRIHGHVGFADFNARLRNDAPVRVRIEYEDAAGTPVTHRLIATDAQGWLRFDLDLELNVGTDGLRVVVDPGATGTWQRGRYRPDRARQLCLDFRSFTRRDGEDAS